MLVLTRKQGEKIRIGDDVVITVVRTKGKTVRLGIQAPAHVPVLRGEIAAAIAGEAHRSAHAAGEETADSDGESESDGVAKQMSALPSCSASSASVVSVAGRGPLHEMMAARC
jgi:carbon storage regulator